VPGMDPADPSIRPGPDEPPKGDRPQRPPGWRALVPIAIGAALVVAVIVLHITGALGPGAH
jgi:hypothetical protein